MGVEFGEAAPLRGSLTPRALPSWTVLLAGAVCVAMGVAADATFLPHQSIWLDEAVQLNGISLGPAEATRWLAGQVKHDFGVADDRMPPLSYLAGWVWSKAFGLAETPMRWLGVACVASATAVVFLAGRRAWGFASGVAAALLLALSPNVVVQAVEIRAYPLLILTSSGVFACLLGYAGAPEDSRERRRWLVGVAACGIAAMYTHFFGLVVTGGALLSAFVLARKRRSDVRPVLAAGLAVAASAVGLAPFVLASVGSSKGGAASPQEGKLAGIARLAYRVVSHPTMSMSKVAVGTAALGFGIAMVVAIVPKRGHPSAAKAACLLLTIISGSAVVAFAGLAQSSFDALKPSYGVWMLPGVALLLASGLGAGPPALRRSAYVGITLLTSANLYADYQFAMHGDAFAHSPHRPIAELIRKLGPGRVAVVHEAESKEPYLIYSPIRYEFGPDLHQFRVEETVPTPGVLVSAYPNPKGAVDLDAVPCDAVIVIDAVTYGAVELTDQIKQGIRPGADGSAVKALLASPHWKRTDRLSLLSFIRADVSVFTRVP